MAKLEVFGCLEKYLFMLFCFELREAQKSHCVVLRIAILLGGSFDTFIRRMEFNSL